VGFDGRVTRLAWDTLLPLDGAGPLHQRLERALREAIRAGRVPVGSALPPSRALAEELRCSRWAVTRAYEQLVAEGYLEARVGSATRVKWTPPRDGRKTVVPAAGPYTLAFRYAYSTGLFGGVLNRPEGIKVNGTLVTSAMDFPVTGDFETYQTASIVVNLRAGANSIQMFNLDGASISRVDTLTVTPVAEGSCVTLPPTPAKLSGLAQSATLINLSWSPSAAPASCTVKSYDVFRSTNPAFVPSADNEIANGLASAAYADKTALCNLTYYYSVAAVDEAGGSVPSLPFTVSTNACPASSTIQINSGGPAVSSFLADEDFSGGSVVATSEAIQTVNVPKGLPMEVFQDSRTGNFSYTVKGFAPNSNHTVTLYFVEPTFDGVGSRLFNVSINGNAVLSNFDVFLAAGDNDTPLAEKISAAADGSGQYVITFTPVLNDAVLSGLQIK